MSYPSTIDEDALEEAYWLFDEERRRTGAERDAFKHKVRTLIRTHLFPLMEALESAEVYLVAVTTDHTPPGGKERAYQVKRKIGELLAAYRVAGGTL